MLHEDQRGVRRNWIADTEHRVGHDAISFEHDFTAAQQQQREAYTVRRIGREQLVGNRRNRFAHGHSR